MYIHIYTYKHGIKIEVGLFGKRKEKSEKEETAGTRDGHGGEHSQKCLIHLKKKVIMKLISLEERIYI